METDLSIKIGGEAGQGLQAIGFILAKSIAKEGLYIFANRDVMSRIRGGHNFFQIRISDKPIQTFSEKIHVIIALDQQTIFEHQDELVDEGVVISDGDRIKLLDRSKNYLNVPFEKLAEVKTGRKIMANSVAVGSALSLLNCNFSYLESVLNEEFREKSVDIAKKNVLAARTGYDYVKEKFKQESKFTVKSIKEPADRIFMTGNEAITSGALISGCKFMSGYPMSPSTPIQQFFASKMKDFPIVYEQAEDEISAINMILGASFTGVRAMTATSGGGFSLMVEGLSLAGMTETPVVIAIAQRPGPATGFPTRTEQGELEFAIYAGHGEFPRVVFAPGNAEQAFHLTSKAFNLAERYQIPVIILSDQFLSDSYFTVDRSLLPSSIKVDRGKFFSESDVKILGEYKRHLITDSGVSPRLFPGQNLGLVVTDSDEHTEDGHITELADVRINNVRKRLKKCESIRKEIHPPFVYGAEEADYLLIGFGSTLGALKEATNILNSDGIKAKMMHFSEIWPFPADAFLKGIDKSVFAIDVESNATGQMAHIIRAETGFKVDAKILRFDGRPISFEYIIRELKKVR